MGIHSTFTAIPCDFAWPEWFVEKYNKTIGFIGDIIYPKTIGKTYLGEKFANLAEDIQKCVDWDKQTLFVIMFLDDDDRVEKVDITKDHIERYYMRMDMSDIINAPVITERLDVSELPIVGDMSESGLAILGKSYFLDD